MNQIEGYLSEEIVNIEGASYPAECLLEDGDGIRVGVVRDLNDIPTVVWNGIHAGGARYVVAPDPVAGWRAVHIDRILQAMDGGGDLRDERRRAGIGAAAPGRTSPLPESVWSVHPHFPSYRDLYGATRTVTGEFAHLHAHSEFSLLDGLSKVDEMVAAAVADNQPALAVTDHGVCASHPTLQKQARAAGIKPIFGIEANFVDDRHDQNKDTLHDYRHLILWAKTDEGLRNLWAMSTEAYRTGFYGRPRLDWEILDRYHTGVMASTACMRGPLAVPILADDEEKTRQVLGKLLGIFGDDLFMEIHTTAMQEQAVVNLTSAALALEFGQPMIAVTDSHYPTINDKQTHQVWIASQTNKTLQEESSLFGGTSNYHLMSAVEVRQALDYLPPDIVDQAMKGTLEVVSRCDVTIEGKSTPPIYSKATATADAVSRDVERLLTLCIDNWGKCLMDTYPQEVYEARFEREMRLLIDKGFCGYFLMVADYCQWARKHGILVGPGRGSGSGSLVSYLAGITGIDPVETGLMFERFLTEGRLALPDFDVDFPASHRQAITDYIVGRYGEENVVRVGTQIRLKNKGIIRDLARTLKGTEDVSYADANAISKLIDEAEADKAGLGMSWEDLWAENEEALIPFRDKYPVMFTNAEKMVGRVKTFGKHAAGVVIAPDAHLTERLPLRRASSKDHELVAEFDMDALDEFGFVKFDLLTLRTLDTIQMAVDLIRGETGEEIDPASWRDEFNDPVVWDELSDGHTLGVFQIETPGGTRWTKELRPQSLDDLADLLTLVRPGPVRSGLTATYLRRKAGTEGISVPDPRLQAILANTYGCMIYQEQVLQICMTLGGYTETEADDVRKILGKKQVEKVEEAGKQFISRAVANQTNSTVAEIIWGQMAEFSRYAFNRSHAYGYAVLGFWCAWLKFHYPVQFLAASLSTVDKARIPAFVNEARRMGFKVLPPDLNLSGQGFTVAGKDIRYGFDGVKGIGSVVVEHIIRNQPYENFQDFMERRTSKVNLGVVKILAQVGAFDTLVPNRRALEYSMEWDQDGANRCHFRDDRVLGPNGLPCTFDWTSEPVLLGIRGTALKPKPIPKRCTKACRNYTEPTSPDFDSTEWYTPEEILARELDMLGIYLSYSPFDRLPPEIFTEEIAEGVTVVKGSAVEAGGVGYEFVTVGLINRVRHHIDKNGKDMAFIGLNAVDADLDLIVFKDEWARYYRDLKIGNLCYVVLKKNDRGLSLRWLQATT